MSELLREIQEDIRNERLERLWHSFGRLMIGASVAVIAITIVVVVWQDHKKDYASAQTSQFIKGLDRFKVEDYDGAVEVFQGLAADTGSSYYGMAMLHKAEAELLRGDREAAARTYGTLAAQGGGMDTRAFSDLAKILSASSPEKLITPDKDSPFYYTQSEWKAWQLMQKGDREGAIAIFTELRGAESVPHSLRERAGLVLEHLGVEAPAPKVASNE